MVGDSLRPAIMTLKFDIDHSEVAEFGRPMRNNHFLFHQDYMPLNHGSYGAFPREVRDYQRQLQDETEARSDPTIRYRIPELLQASRSAIAPMLGVDINEVAFVPNATTGLNTILRNIQFEPGDVILHFDTVYPACEKSVEYICEITPVERVAISITYPCEDNELIDTFEQTVTNLRKRGKRPRLALFDTVTTFPGVRVPWEALVKACKKNSILSLVDGAHGIGHIDLQHLGTVSPDFFTSNCYKWLFTPRSCAIFCVPFRNQHLIRSSMPTSHGFQPARNQQKTPAADDFAKLFAWVATTDTSLYPTVPAALAFRQNICGGEDVIRNYCFDLARRGGQLVAEMLGTEYMDNATHSITQCCFANVRLPLTFATKTRTHDEPCLSFELEDGPRLQTWLTDTAMNEHDTWMAFKYYAGAIWVRLSAQIYLELRDFEWAAATISAMCARLHSQKGQEDRLSRST